MDWQRVVEIAVRADGVIAVERAAALTGTDPRVVRQRAARDGWQRPFPRVMVHPGFTVRRRTLARAAVLNAAPAPAAAVPGGAGRLGATRPAGAALTRSSALALLGHQRSYPTLVELAVEPRRRLRAHDRVTLVRSRYLEPADVGWIAEVPHVRGPALVRDLAAVRSVPALRSVVIDLQTSGEVVLDELAARMADWSGAPGIGRLRRVVAELRSAGRTDSPLELRVRRGLVAAGVPLDPGQVAVPGTRMHLDLGIAAIRFGIEVDSLAHHASRHDLQRDVERTNALIEHAADWEVMRVTWWTVEHGWPTFVRRVQTVVARRSRAILGDDGP